MLRRRCWSMPDVAAVILAAGASRRMGTPKQLLRWGETTLLGRAIAAARASRCSTVYVVLGAPFCYEPPDGAKQPLSFAPNWSKRKRLFCSSVTGGAVTKYGRAHPPPVVRPLSRRVSGGIPMRIMPGRPYPLGATWDGAGC